MRIMAIIPARYASTRFDVVTVGIDTPADLEEARRLLEKS